MTKIDPRIKVLPVLIIAIIAVFLVKIFADNDSHESPDYLPRPISESNDQLATETQAPELPEIIIHDAPFTPQAPLGNWEDVRENNGCEEASLLMAVYWARDLELTPEIAQQEIRKISDFHLKTEGHFHDLSNADTFALLGNYFEFENAELRENIGTGDIIGALAENGLVIVPVSGTRIGNPNYQLPGPLNHKIVIVGYDNKTREFITHDPGTNQGENYRYSYEVLESALEDYPTGYQEKFDERKTSMIIVRK